MKKIIQSIFVFLFTTTATFGQSTDTINQLVDTLKKVSQQKNGIDRPGVKNAVQIPTTQKSKEQIPATQKSTKEKQVIEGEQQKPATQKSTSEREVIEEQEQQNVDDEKMDKNIATDEEQQTKKEAVDAAKNDKAVKNSTTFLVKIYDRNTMKTIDGVEVYLFEMPDGKFVDTNLSFNGIASFEIDRDTEYEVRTCQEGYIKRAIGIFDCNSADKVFCLRGVFHFDYGPPETKENTLLAKIKMDPIAVGQTMELDNVYYDIGKSTLRPESKKELDRLYNLMKQYRTLKIELTSHTDSRGSAENNMKLSANRAKACYTYLVNKGIGKDKIVYKGYGETRLLNECADGVECGNEQHQINRRTEISILEIVPEPCEPKL